MNFIEDILTSKREILASKKKIEEHNSFPPNLKAICLEYCDAQIKFINEIEKDPLLKSFIAAYKSQGSIN